MNLNAAKLACKEAGISEEEFYEAIASFKGAANRLEKVAERDGVVIFKDFAHSPSKLKATINAVKQQYGDKKLIACMELHTFSSLNKDFLAEYAHSMDGADEAIVFVDEKVLIQKKMPPISENDITQSFLREIIFFNNSEKLERFLLNVNAANCNVLFMSSGNFGGIDLVTLSKKILKNEINC
ncbi:peptidoglycan synthetase, partial [Pseudoxanthomonas sp. SGD-10]